MLDYYEINDTTLVLIPIQKELTKIIETEKTYLITKNIYTIIDDSCKTFGSSYQGRHEGTKRILGIKYKTPIIVSEINNIIFFPTTSPKLDSCAWISLNNLENYKRKGTQSIIYFKNNKIFKPCVSYFIVENQIYKATMLDSKLKKMRK